MSKTYTPIATFPSSSNPSKEYTVSVDEQGGLSCNCPAWTFKKQGIRTCKHVKTVESGENKGNLVPASPAPEPVQTGPKEHGGSLADLFAKLGKAG